MVYSMPFEWITAYLTKSSTVLISKAVSFLLAQGRFRMYSVRDGWFSYAHSGMASSAVGEWTGVDVGGVWVPPRSSCVEGICGLVGVGRVGVVGKFALLDSSLTVTV